MKCVIYNIAYLFSCLFRLYFLWPLDFKKRYFLQIMTERWYGVFNIFFELTIFNKYFSSCLVSIYRERYLVTQILHKFYCSILILLSLKDYFKVKYHIYKWQFSFLIFLSFAMIQHSSFIILLFFRFSYFTYRCNFFWNCFNWIYF